jgi:dephospho-CoA kinase
MLLLGLTGSIGMGKSTTAAMFASAKVPVYDADAAVHELYQPGGPAAAPIEAAFPGVTAAGGVDRPKLSAALLADPQGFKRLEAIVHPLLAAHRLSFLQAAGSKGSPIAVLDIPLLFETGGEKALDAVAVVSCGPDEQRRRVLERPGMTEAKFEAILSRQTPDAEKRRRADFVIDTGGGLAAAEAQVRAILNALRDPSWRSRRAEHPSH